jgi:hypothetical protein
MHHSFSQFVMTALLTGALASLMGCQTIPSVRSASIESRTPSGSLSVTFTNQDHEFITRYYEPDRHPHRKGLPPGLAKKGKIPPGHARRFHRRESLPPGIAMQRLPDDLERRLSRIPNGYSRQKIGFNIVLIDNNTRLVVDVIHLNR